VAQHFSHEDLVGEFSLAHVVEKVVKLLIIRLRHEGENQLVFQSRRQVLVVVIIALERLKNTDTVAVLDILERVLINRVVEVLIPPPRHINMLQILLYLAHFFLDLILDCLGDHPFTAGFLDAGK
jgi:hypothetical protein